MVKGVKFTSRPPNVSYSDVRTAPPLFLLPPKLAPIPLVDLTFIQDTHQVLDLDDLRVYIPYS